jgi:hypothetical protein
MRLAIATVLLTLAAGAVQAGEPAYKAPRDPYGRPSFEGIWTTNTATPLERPAGLSTLTIDAVAAKAFEAKAADAFFNNGDPVGARQSEVWERGWELLRLRGEIRTSMVVEPADGKLPYTAFAKSRKAELDGGTFTDFRGPEYRPPPDRCLSGNSGNSSVPMLPANYNNNYQFMQTKDHLAISMEPMHEMRIIPLGPRRAAPSAPVRWAGNSVGWFEGQTLVVETAGLNPVESHKAPGGPFISEQARVTERFTRIGKDQVLYEFTVDDPKAFESTWRAQTLMTATPGPLYEYACHEGNYALEGILAGGRQLDAAAGK